MDGDEIVYEFGDDQPETVDTGEPAARPRLPRPPWPRKRVLVAAVVSLALGAVGMALWQAHSDDQNRRSTTDVVMTLIAANQLAGGPEPNSQMLEMSIAVANAGPTPLTLLSVDSGNAPMHALSTPSSARIASGQAFVYTLDATAACPVPSGWSPMARSSYFTAKVKTADGITRAVRATLQDQQGQLLTTLGEVCPGAVLPDPGNNVTTFAYGGGDTPPAVRGDTVVVPIVATAGTTGQRQIISIAPIQIPGLQVTLDPALAPLPAAGKVTATIDVKVTDCSQVQLTPFSNSVGSLLADDGTTNTAVDGSTQSAIAMGVGEICAPHWPHSGQ